MKRVVTAVIGIPVFVGITLFAPYRVFAFNIGIVAAAAVEELMSLGAARGFGRPGRWFFVAAALVAISFTRGPAWVVAMLVSSTLLLLAACIFSSPIEAGLERVAIGLSGLLYCSATLGFLVLLPRKSILVLFAIIWIGDAAAYYGGSAFGRHSLAPRISPKKTVEGAVAGLIGSLGAGMTLGTWLLGWPWLKVLEISFLTAVVGQIGDLAESLLKRSAGVKDSSSILPGHGGILDRLDSLFFATPVFYWFLNR